MEEAKTESNIEEISVELTARSIFKIEDIDSIPTENDVKIDRSEYLSQRIQERLPKKNSGEQESMKISILLNTIWAEKLPDAPAPLLVTEAVQCEVKGTPEKAAIALAKGEYDYSEYKVRGLALMVPCGRGTARDCAKKLVQELETRIELILEKLGTKNWGELKASCVIGFGVSERVLYGNITVRSVDLVRK